MSYSALGTDPTKSDRMKSRPPNHDRTHNSQTTLAYLFDGHSWSTFDRRQPSRLVSLFRPSSTRTAFSRSPRSQSADHLDPSAALGKGQPLIAVEKLLTPPSCWLTCPGREFRTAALDLDPAIETLASTAPCVAFSSRGHRLRMALYFCSPALEGLPPTVDRCGSAVEEVLNSFGLLCTTERRSATVVGCAITESDTAAVSYLPAMTGA